MLMPRALSFASRNFRYSRACEFSKRTRAAPRMLSLMTRVQAIDGLLHALEELAHPREHHIEGHPDERQGREHRERELPIEHEQQRARAHDEEQRGDDGGDGLGHEGLDGVHVRGEVSQELGGGHVLDGRVFLHRDGAGQLAAQVARDQLGGIHLPPRSGGC